MIRDPLASRFPQIIDRMAPHVHTRTSLLVDMIGRGVYFVCASEPISGYHSTDGARAHVHSHLLCLESS